MSLCSAKSDVLCLQHYSIFDRFFFEDKLGILAVCLTSVLMVVARSLMSLIIICMASVCVYVTLFMLVAGRCCSVCNKRKKNPMASLLFLFEHVTHAPRNLMYIVEKADSNQLAANK